MNRQFLLTMHEDDSVTMHAYVEPSVSKVYYVELLDDQGNTGYKGLHYTGQNEHLDAIEHAKQICDRRGMTGIETGRYWELSHISGPTSFRVFPAFNVIT